MNYSTALWILKNVRERAPLLPGWYDILNAPLDVPQHLTGSYSERVTGGKPYENPVIKAMSRQDAAKRNAQSEIAYTHKLMRLARSAIKRVRSEDSRQFLYAYYLTGATGSAIKAGHGWNTTQYNKARRDALRRLRSALR